MGINFKLLLLLPLVVCTEQPYGAPPHSYTGRLTSLALDIAVFTVITNSLNYDAYFIAPVFTALKPFDLMETGFLDFFAKDFKMAVHAKDFHFSETETRKEFAKRFFRYIGDAENVPSKIREKAAVYARNYTTSPFNPTKGVISPCPLYSFVRAITLLKEDKKIRGDIDSVEVIIKFLLTEFNPLDYNIEDKANIKDIEVTIWHQVGIPDKPLKLLDGSLAYQRNKELFERLATEESVPQNVKDAIEYILPHM